MTEKLKYYKGELVKYEVFKLVDFYDPILRQPTVPVRLETVEDMARAEYLLHSLSETMIVNGGLGLSANQVGLKDRVCVINMGENIWIMFNPEIIEKSPVPSTFSEGCLSYPGLYLKVDRSDRIKVKFQAVGGQFVEQEFTGLTAVCIQHEIDHLDGALYTQKVSPIKLEQAKRKVKKNIKAMRRMTQKPQTEAVELVETPQLQVQEAEKVEKKMPDTFVYTVG